MATAPEISLHMRSTDLIKREPLDYGGFGEVYLCYHATLGQVVLKTVYTGPLRNEENKKSLLEEGSIMASLNHKRVVKLLGVIMEDRDCSLIIELLPRGNLLVMLEKVAVPISIKGRIILEILEGMVYLTERHVIHKDIKPENILVDKDFHIKIADLGLATCQAWNKLTRQESRRKSHRGATSGDRGAGTLSYMAPEHLESINTPSSVKSDVYSFAIVVWVILTGKEPYENARSDDHISQCVRRGDRPAVELIPEDTPAEIIDLMKRCWAQDPIERPTFQEAYDSFLPFYKEKLEPLVEEDVCLLQEQYEGPDELVEKIKSLSMTHDSFSATDQDGPASLSSHRDLSMPVEASIEDLHNINDQPSGDPLETDARMLRTPSELEEKLDREFNYHKHGSYACNNQPESAQGLQRNPSNPFFRNPFNFSDNGLRLPAEENSSVHSWTKPEQEQPTSQTEAYRRPTSDLYGSITSYSSNHSLLHPSFSTPSLSQFDQQQPRSLDRQQSCPIYPVSDTFDPNRNAGNNLTSSKSGSMQETGSLYIRNASGIQIGNNNTMSIRSSELSQGLFDGNTASPIQEGIFKYADHVVKESQLEVLRENIGMKWKRCARRLGLTEVEIETIEHDYYRDGLPEMVHQMLESWKRKQGSLNCTIGRLCQALQGNIKVDVIQKILDLCDSSE
ncbi:PREDICTED: receptor-interacting serine/threonine-protein kinase 1 [Poecilia mexicana]|uniref:Receptor (TNFRSF)-interacting serine-threonine kinase 1, like n=1 Tax=Poecilia mexicana TaxID=48701 RepID=A0A3B3XQ93_9TELE|nr:PREDICTED: receptor-interacting serine/threonine-protein kinase 1 [Poecilia mexicana]XP_014855993.1 PREDICTED: receptor-interacting serine/threonine-protein kinase 1 [Poecilia mexicana]